MGENLERKILKNYQTLDEEYETTLNKLIQLKIGKENKSVQNPF